MRVLLADRGHREARVVEAGMDIRVRVEVLPVALAERGLPERTSDQKRVVTAVMRRVGEQLGNTPAVARASYVSPAVIEQYLDGRTIDDFRARHLRVVRAREMDLDQEEQGAPISVCRTPLRPWREMWGRLHHLHA